MRKKNSLHPVNSGEQKVFNFFLKQTVVSIFLMLSGSVFHIDSNARVKDLPARADRSPLGLARNRCPSDLRWRVGLFVDEDVKVYWLTSAPFWKLEAQSCYQCAERLVASGDPS